MKWKLIGRLLIAINATEVLIALMPKNLEWSNALDHEGETPLSIAAKNGHTAALISLLQIHSRETFLANALRQAAKGGHTEVIQVLLRRAAGLIISPAMFQAAIVCPNPEGRRTTIELFLNSGANMQEFMFESPILDIRNSRKEEVNVLDFAI